MGNLAISTLRRDVALRHGRLRLPDVLAGEWLCRRTVSKFVVSRLADYDDVAGIGRRTLPRADSSLHREARVKRRRPDNKCAFKTLMHGSVIEIRYELPVFCHDTQY